MPRRPLIAIGMLGTTLDRGRRGPARWEQWRPTVALCQHEDLLIDRLVLIHPERAAGLARAVAEDIQQVSPETKVVFEPLDIADPWDLEQTFRPVFQSCAPRSELAGSGRA
jgi:transcriptional regulatory protein RtcR